MFDDLRIENGRPHSRERATECASRTQLVLKLRCSELVVRRSFNGFLSRFGVYCIAFKNDFSQFWNFDLYTR